MSIFNQEINDNNLRDCQKEAYHASYDHFNKEKSDRHVLVQLPTGTGKSALIAISPFQIATKKVLILTPNLTLAEQLKEDIDIIDNPENNIYKKLNIFSDGKLEELELYVLKLDSKANFEDINEHQVILSNYQQFKDVEKWFKGRENMIDLIIIDEAHHQKANTYQEIINFFPNAKIISLTATPFRSDGQKIEGENIYTYHFSDAIKQNYIRNIKISNVSPEEISLSFNDKNSKKYTLEEIIGMKEEAWFRKNIALSQDCCDSIAQKSYDKLQDLRNNFPKSTHQIIASAMSIRHAREFVKPAFEKLGLKVGLVNSKEERKSNKQTLEKLKQERIDVIINVGMLGEGFDHKKLGVAAIFKPFASLNPYIQFIGRVIRKNEDTKYCWVVSHLGLNQIKRFEEFKLFDNEDKEFLHTLFDDNSGGKEHSFIDDESENLDSKKDREEISINEIGRNLIEIESDFVKSSEENNLEKLDTLLANLTPEEKEKAKKKYGLSYDRISKKSKKRIKPINKRRAAKNSLNESAKSITTNILKKIGLSGRFRYRDFNPTKTNFAWVQVQISRDINKKLNIDNQKRNELTYSQIQSFIQSGELEKIEKQRTEYYKKKLEEKHNSK